MELALPLPLRALIIGFTISAAVGPISLLVVRRTISHGTLYGWVSGLGVATADLTYGAVAAFGLTAVTAVLVSARVALGLIGGLVIVYLGYRTIRTVPGEVARDTERPGMLGAFLSIYALTMTNPLTILLFAGVFAGLGLGTGATFVDAAVLTLAVGAGSALWWTLVAPIVGWARERVSTRILLWINRLSGLALVLFGILAIVSAVTSR
jgi:threonine/homoserine/homoserine lactone efflux protein